MLKQAGYFAERLTAATSALDQQTCGEAQVELAFRLAFGRKPSSDERSAAAEYIRSAGLPAFCSAMLNANEFVYVD